MTQTLFTDIKKAAVKLNYNNHGSGCDFGGADFFFQSARNVAERLLVLTIIWVVGWTPFTVVSSVQLMGYGKYINKNINVLSMMFCKVSSILNVGMYGMR
jgi:hypothetical protein